MYVLGGGIIDNIFSDIYSFNLTTLEWCELRPRNSEVYIPSLSSTAVTYHDAVYMFAGMMEGKCHNRLLRLSMEEGGEHVWDNLSLSEGSRYEPSPRKGHVSVVYQSYMYVLNGSDFLGFPFQDFYRYGLETNVWEVIDWDVGRYPDARIGHSAAVDTEDGIMYVSGGYNGFSFRNDVHAYDFATGVWRVVVNNIASPQSPPGRYSHVSWFDPTTKHLFIFGGDSNNCTVYYSDVWCLDLTWGTSWTRIVFRNEEYLPPLSGHALALHHGVVYVFGGEVPLTHAPSFPSLFCSEEVGYSRNVYRMPVYADQDTTLAETTVRALAVSELEVGGMSDVETTIGTLMDVVLPRGLRKDVYTLVEQSRAIRNR
eukprot:PhF_6_TR19066/c0_g1_i1/m.28029